LSLIYTTLRGIVLAREEKPFAGKKEEEVDYQKKKIKLPNPPSFLILDSKGDLHVYYYYDTRYSAPQFSMFIRPLSIQEWSKKQGSLGKRLENQRVKNRSKSQYKKVARVGLSQEKKRSKSEIKRMDSKSQIKITYIFGMEGSF